ncbi:MAG: 50S ribosomal protein L29 [Thermoplasmata archaeon]
MALLRTKEIREMTPEERQSRLKDLRDELMHERGVAAMGGAPPSPGKIRALRRNISRLLTVLTEREGSIGVKETVTETTEEERA